ncbi:MAG: DMT family transporter [Alphaproteobacteria bacterium]
MTVTSIHAAHSTVRGIALYSLAILLLATMDSAIKWLSADYPTGQIVFFRAAFGLLPLAVLVAGSGGPAALKTRRPLAHLGRGLIGAGAAFCFFFAFSVMPLADAYAIAFAAPLFMTALGVPMLGERVGAHRWSAVVVGFVGVLIMLRPGTVGLDGILGVGTAAAIAGTFLFAVAATLIRRLSRTESNAAIVFYGTGVMMAASAISLPFGFVPPTPADFVLLAAVGLLGGIGTIAMTAAFRAAPIAVLAPFEYTAMIWAVAFGYALWDDLPDGWIITGATIVVASGLYILHRETRRRVTPCAMPRVAAGRP